MERPEKYGGTIVFESYSELEQVYREGKLHPLDLKNAVAEALIELLQPVRNYFEQNSEAKLILEELKRVTITR